MNRTLMQHGFRIVFAAIIAAASTVTAQDLNQPPKGFTALFDGESTSGWYGWGTKNPEKLWEQSAEEQSQTKLESRKDIEQHWSVKDGILINDGHGLYLTSEKEFGDFELHLEYKTVALADSGIYLKATPQVQIWDYTEEKKFKIGADKGSGGLWNNSAGANGKDPLVLADKPFGEWNKFRIRQLGARTSIWLNDKKVVENAIHENYFDRKRPLFAKGPIQLQTHGGEISWRNVFVKEFSSEEANKILHEESGKDGFTKLFNGTDMTGWAGAAANYQVKDGAIMCKAGKGGTVYYDKELGDFVARFEFKLPPGGNNGLAIRYPGDGDTAYNGMCELQVLDSEHKKYANKLDARQYHGSAYGMVPAHRGYLRPTGKWNYQEVTVKGSTIKVELNGTMILDCDLSTVKEFMADSPHPGMTRERGYFGFAGHGDPVQFRNVEVKEL